MKPRWGYTRLEKKMNKWRRGKSPKEMDTRLQEGGCWAGGDGEGPDLGSVDALSSVFARLRRSHAEHSQACDTLEGLIAQENREQQEIKAEIERTRKRLQAAATRDSHHGAVVANLTSSVAVMRGQIRVAETEKTRLQEEHGRAGAEAGLTASIIPRAVRPDQGCILTAYERVQLLTSTRYAGRLVDNAQLEYRVKIDQLGERKSAAASRVTKLEKKNKQQALEDWKKFQDTIVMLLKTRKKLGEEWEKKRQQETRIRSLREAIQKKELELAARKEREAALERQKATARTKPEQPPPRSLRWLLSLQKVSQKPEMNSTEQTTGKIRRDTPRPNRFDTGLDLLKASKLRKKSHITSSSGGSRSEDTPHAQSASAESPVGDRVTSQPGPSPAPARSSLNLGQSPILVSSQASFPVAAKDSRCGASAQSPAPSVPTLVLSSKAGQGQLPTGPSPGDGTPSRPSTSYNQDSNISLGEHRLVASSSHQGSSFEFSGHLADVSNTSESTQDQNSYGRSLLFADTPSPSISSGFGPRNSSGSSLPTSSSNFVNELSSITETEESMDEKNQSGSSEDVWYTPPSPSQLPSKDARQAYVSSLLSGPEFTFKAAPTPKIFSKRVGPSESFRQSDISQNKISSTTTKNHSRQHLGGSDQAQEWAPGQQLKSTIGQLEMELESGVGESPKCQSNTIRTSTPGKTPISQIDYSAHTAMVVGEDTTTSECTELNKAGFMEDMEVETEEASDQMMNSSQLQSSQGFIVEADGEVDDTRTHGTDLADKSSIGCVEVPQGALTDSRVASALTTAPPSSTPPSNITPAFTHSTPSSTTEVHKDLFTSSLCVDMPSSSDSSTADSALSTPYSVKTPVSYAQSMPTSPVQNESRTAMDGIGRQEESGSSSPVPKLPVKRNIFYSSPVPLSEAGTHIPVPSSSNSPTISWTPHSSSPFFASESLQTSVVQSQVTSRRPEKPPSPGSPFGFMLGGRSDAGRVAAGALSLFGSPENTDGLDTSQQSSGVNFSLFGDSQPSQERDSGGGFFNFSFSGTQGSPSTNFSPGNFLSSLFDGSSSSSSSRSSEREGGGAGFKLF
ncbi:flocculation protein FLO11-like [Penaeus chinensis]|uniref:flocculation protein FLO11-like n=1 Tax=Penaeus chinensis TaxID=139456 RepID=UPI001FB6001F|nr:flocculation protein FLO11-like [Penaeus chinensis]